MHQKSIVTRSTKAMAVTFSHRLGPKRGQVSLAPSRFSLYYARTTE